MRVRHSGGFVAFEVADDSPVALALREVEIRANFARHFGFVSADQREQMVRAEMAGVVASARALTTWCKCDTTDEQTAYYLRENGRHGWFHDPALGGCGGITQTG